MRIGVLTSGGDCPGLNAVIRGLVLKGTTAHDLEFVGVRDGWRGLIEADHVPLGRHEVKGLSKVGGTILGTSRTHPYDTAGGGPENLQRQLSRAGIDGVVAIGGEGTLAGANRLAADGLPVVGVPKTIDNDLGATDYSFGFDTAVNIATDAMDRLRTTGDSHRRVMVAEVMGRDVGWIALHSGLASGAHVILLPEVPLHPEEVCEHVRSAHDRGRAPLVVVSEGFTFAGGSQVHQATGSDPSGRPRLGGIGEVVAAAIAAGTGLEVRTTVLGYIQRGGAPSAFDRVLATRLGLHAADLVAEQGWGQMVALRGTEIVRVPMAEAVGALNTVPRHRYDEAAALFG